jgi:hypothetical protein
MTRSGSGFIILFLIKLDNLGIIKTTHIICVQQETLYAAFMTSSNPQIWDMLILQIFDAPCNMAHKRPPTKKTDITPDIYTDGTKPILVLTCSNISMKCFVLHFTFPRYRMFLPFCCFNVLLLYSVELHALWGKLPFTELYFIFLTLSYPLIQT